MVLMSHQPARYDVPGTAVGVLQQCRYGPAKNLALYWQPALFRTLPQLLYRLFPYVPSDFAGIAAGTGTNQPALLRDPTPTAVISRRLNGHGMMDQGYQPTRG